MRSWIDHCGLATLTTVVLAVLLSAPSHALDNCRASVRATDGVILVSATRVTGPLEWGAADGAETNTFANAATCLKGLAALGCQLGAPGTPEQITPPQLCRVFLSDGVARCSAHIRGCTPGLRAAVAGPQISYVTCTGSTGTGGGASSSCAATCPANTKIVSGVCANISNPQVPQFTQGLISDPGTNTTWSCTVRNQNQLGSPGTIAAQGTAICLPQD